MVGPMILVLLVMGVAEKDQGWFAPKDIAFLIVLVTVIFARWFEFRAGNPLTSTGDPATPAVLRRYILGVFVLGVGIWTFANLLGNHWPAH